MTYSDAGVDIDAGDALVEAIKPLAASTKRPGADTELGGFGGLFDIAGTGFQKPILVAATDGVGSKLKIGIDTGLHDTIGIDLVAMCVNDVIVQGATPLFFLDYFATGQLHQDIAEQVIGGIAEGCRQAGCALIGGETAVMPGIYQNYIYDLAGFAVGAVERTDLITGREVAMDDVILGLASSGLHANGFSLVRRIVELSNSDLSAPAPFSDNISLGEALLLPTRIYVKSCLSAIRVGGVHAIAHITGGGLIENLPRVLPLNQKAEIDRSTWTSSPVFDWIASEGGVTQREMLRTFNCGIGMVVIVDPNRVNDIEEVLTQEGEVVHRIGRITEREGGPAIQINGVDI